MPARTGPSRVTHSVSGSHSDQVEWSTQRAKKLLGLADEVRDVLISSTKFIVGVPVKWRSKWCSFCGTSVVEIPSSFGSSDLEIMYKSESVGRGVLLWGLGRLLASVCGSAYADVVLIAAFAAHSASRRRVDV